MTDIRRLFLKEFDPIKIDTNGSLTTELSYIVEIDGTISEIKAIGNSGAFNKETERVFKKINSKLKWKPGIVNNEFVRSKYRFPIAMSF